MKTETVAMTAKDQLSRLIGELNDEQAERALAVLESSADWVLTGERPLGPPSPRRPGLEHGRRPGATAGTGRHRGC